MLALKVLFESSSGHLCDENLQKERPFLMTGVGMSFLEIYRAVKHSEIFLSSV